MNQTYMRVRLRVTKKYSGSTKSDFWKGLDVGDILVVQTPFEKLERRASTGLHAPFVSVIKNDTEVFSETLNRIQNYLSKIEFEEDRSPESGLAAGIAFVENAIMERPDDTTPETLSTLRRMHFGYRPNPFKEGFNSFTWPDPAYDFLADVGNDDTAPAFDIVNMESYFMDGGRAKITLEASEVETLNDHYRKYLMNE